MDGEGEGRRGCGPEGTTAICRREGPHIGAQFDLCDPGGRRHQVFITKSADDDIVYPEARHRGHAQVEGHIKEADAMGLSHFPAHRFSSNAARLLVVLVAQGLKAWAGPLCLEGDLEPCEPKRLRYCVLHVAGRPARTGRQGSLRSTPPGLG